MSPRGVLLIVLAGFLVAPAQGASAFTLIGGETLPEANAAVRVGVGYPSLYGAVHVPVTPEVELAPKFTFFYGWDTDTVIGNKIGGEVRWTFLKEDEFALALLFEPALVLTYDPEFAVGVQIGGPGVLLSYEFQRGSYVVGGVKLPFGFVFFPDVPNDATDFWASVPLLFVLGSEFRLTENLNLFMELALGPDIIAKSGANRTPRRDSNGTDVEFSPNFHVGISYLF